MKILLFATISSGCRGKDIFCNFPRHNMSENGLTSENLDLLLIRQQYATKFLVISGKIPKLCIYFGVHF